MGTVFLIGGIIEATFSGSSQVVSSGVASHVLFMYNLIILTLE